METVEASLEDWPRATFHTKLEVDANYKRMLEFATRPENARAVRIGVGSHNLFDVAYALLLRKQRGVADRLEFEMLEGMANAQALEVRQRSGNLIVYAPVVLDAEFEAAVAYLVRRLDENTEPGSFLGALFALQEGTPEWNSQRDAFLESCRLSRDPNLLAHSQRTQNRLTENPEPSPADAPFQNIPNTDFSLPTNRRWAEKIIEAWKNKTIEPIPIQIGGQFKTEKLTGMGSDPSRPGHQAYQFAQADADDIDQAIAAAVAAKPAWSGKSIAERATILRQVAAEFARQRGDSIGAMLLDAGKNIKQADVEISEAIDFANYYSRGLDDQGWFDGTSASPLGVVVVTPPWNFPYAIPAGGVLAALMAGNTVILKPARESVLTAWMLAQQFWNAGVPKEVLQFAPTVDGQTGKRLISDDRVDAVILTGSIFTAQLFQSWRPRLRLYAETSGKNSMIISAAADLDLAVKDLVQGAFGHAGQKCSATSLALVQAEVYDQPLFMGKLKDAAESMTIGGSWNPSAQLTPVIRKPDETLERGLTRLEAGETWLLEPRMIDNNPCHWSPGIRLGVHPGSWYHVNECFGPVLGLIRVESFAEAIEIQNSSKFGLTGGLHSLDPEEVEVWREKVEVGNAYINRSTTGAIVRRQPFGGWKDSCVGPGPKAGGPNYVAAFCKWTESELPRLRDKPGAAIASLVKQLSTLLDADAAARLMASAENYAYWWNREFSREHDPSQLHGETNDFRYRARPWHLIRLQSADALDVAQIFQLAIACATVGTDLKISVSGPVGWGELLARVAAVEVVIESAAELVDRLKSLKGGTLRILGEFDEQQFAPAEIGNIPIIDSHVLANGRIELLNYMKEQSVSETVHRYGNIV